MLEHLPSAIGHALEHQRAGMEKILFHSERRPEGTAHIAVTSTAFAPGTPLPQRFTADGDGLSPPLSWEGVPAKASTLAVIVEDADSPTPEPLVHAIIVDIDPREAELSEGTFSGPPELIPEKMGRNSYLMRGWLPPDPPPGHGVHRYAFQVFALAASEPLSRSPGRRELADAIHKYSLGRGCLIGTYRREVTARAANSNERLPADEAVVTMSADTA